MFEILKNTLDPRRPEPRPVIRERSPITSNVRLDIGQLRFSAHCEKLWHETIIGLHTAVSPKSSPFKLSVTLSNLNRFSKILLIFYFHTNTHTETFAPLITCVIDDLLLKTMPDIDQALLQFVDVNFVVERVQICAVGCQRCGEMKAGLAFCHSRRLVVSVHARWAAAAGALHCWKVKNTARMSRTAGSRPIAFESKHVSVTPLIFTAALMNIRSIRPNLDTPIDTITDLLKFECLQQTVWCNSSLF